MKIEHCFTGRKWVNIGAGMLAVGFGPTKLIERVVIFKKYVYIYKGAK